MELTPARRLLKPYRMNTHVELAKSVLDALVDADLIEVEAHDEAVEALARALDESKTADVVQTITQFLDGNDVIDEIFASDTELGTAIKKVLSARAA
jgi:hypothetical protein